LPYLLLPGEEYLHMRQEKWRSFKFERDSIAKSTDKTEKNKALVQTKYIISK
jgi:hypothetical protein